MKDEGCLLLEVMFKKIRFKNIISKGINWSIFSRLLLPLNRRKNILQIIKSRSISTRYRSSSSSSSSSSINMNNKFHLIIKKEMICRAFNRIIITTKQTSILIITQFFSKTSTVAWATIKQIFHQISIYNLDCYLTEKYKSKLQD